MKLITKTATKVVYEVTQQEYQERGFDSLWDEIRENYPEDQFALHTVEQDEDFYFELKPLGVEK